MEKSREFPDFKFTGSKTWLQDVKRRHGIVSRKVQKLVSFRELRNENQIQESVMTFRSEINEIIPNYDPQNVINTDQTGFKYEVYSNRTLSHYGERCTVAALNSPSNKASHSYTVQYMISLSGEIIGDAFLCLQAIF